MKVKFIAPNPRERARPVLDEVLRNGTDQIAIACAFLTGGGAEVLKRHADRLRLPNSFVVVAWEPPTSLDALNELHALFPGNLYLHLGVKTPVEKGVGRGLMHSKVFLSSSGNQRWLWTGSHNLTASAALGVNCEAAVVLEGTANEQPFKDALAHLSRIKSEAIVFDPRNPPPPQGGEQTLIIHAECDVGLNPCPWFVHLRAPTTDYDKALRPPGAVWLYLYAPGALQPGRPRPPAKAAFSGRLTALNFTQYHPRDTGIPAAWSEADYVIEQTAGVFHLSEPTPHTNTPTQGVFRVEQQEDPATVWLTESPSPKWERVVGEERTESIEPEFRKFFTPQSLKGNNLVRREYRDMKPVYRVPRKEVGDLDAPALIERASLPEDTQVHFEELKKTEDKFVFIYRARYHA